MRLILLLAILPIAAASAEAQGSVCRAEGPYLDLSLQGEWDAGDRGAIAAELRAALRVQDFELCIATEEPSDAVARLTLTRRSATLVNIRVRDAVTDKWVEREIDLASFEEDARSLAIAIAADELVRASWAELVLEDAPEPAEPPPPQVLAVVERAVTRAASESATSLPLWIDAAGTIERYAGEELHGGASLGIELWFHSRVGLRLAVGGRRGADREGQLGSVQSRAIVGDLDLVTGLWGDPGRGSQLVAIAGAFVGWVRFRSTAFGDALAADESGTMAGLRAGLGFRHSFGPIRLFAELDLGAPFIGVAALDGDSRLTGVEGVAVMARFGVGASR